MKLRHPRRSLVAFAGLLAILLVGCGGNNGTSTPAGSGSGGGSSSKSQSAGGASAIKIDNFAFSPATDTAKSGASVDVTNDDTTAHTATADDGNSFDTGDINPGSSKSISVKKPGTYPYHCSIHPFMHGKLVVR